MYALILVAAAMFAALVAIGVASWSRTAGLRRGRLPAPARLPPPRPSSFVTRLPSVLGATLFLAGLAPGESAAAQRGVLLAFGAFVLWTGVLGRVTFVDANPLGLVIGYPRRAPFWLPWSDCIGLRPPRTPVGAWRIDGRAIRRRLMPSDLWRREALLSAIVVAADLRFDERERSLLQRRGWTKRQEE